MSCVGKVPLLAFLLFCIIDAGRSAETGKNSSEYLRPNERPQLRNKRTAVAAEGGTRYEGRQGRGETGDRFNYGWGTEGCDNVFRRECIRCYLPDLEHEAPEHHQLNNQETPVYDIGGIGGGERILVDSINIKMVTEGTIIRIGRSTSECCDTVSRRECMRCHFSELEHLIPIVENRQSGNKGTSSTRERGAAEGDGRWRGGGGRGGGGGEVSIGTFNIVGAKGRRIESEDTTGRGGAEDCDTFHIRECERCYFSEVPRYQQVRYKRASGGGGGYEGGSGNAGTGGGGGYGGGGGGGVSIGTFTIGVNKVRVDDSEVGGARSCESVSWGGCRIYCNSSCRNLRGINKFCSGTEVGATK